MVREKVIREKWAKESGPKRVGLKEEKQLGLEPNCFPGCVLEVVSYNYRCVLPLLRYCSMKIFERNLSCLESDF
jgi:hypothetical protein